MNLSLAIEGEFLNTLGNVAVFFWNAGMRYEKDSNGNRIVDNNGNYILKHPENKFDYIKNNIGGELKLDYYLSPIILLSTGVNATNYDKSFFGKSISNFGYFCETQVKTSRHSDIYLFGQFGRVTSKFSNTISLNHFQYTTGLGIGNDSFGLDVGVNFFSTPNEQKIAFLENYEALSPEQIYLESSRVMLRLTAKFL